mgnify:FL=1|tara:strand:+ start:274 stop:528 length:255 start_codon:yes stop_codon:yes gene_type:complete
MKEKNLPHDINSKSLNELREMASNIIKKLESEKDLESLMEEYQKLIKLNNIIEKKFQNSSREISNKTKEKIAEIINYKNGKKIK